MCLTRSSTHINVRLAAGWCTLLRTGIPARSKRNLPSTTARKIPSRKSRSGLGTEPYSALHFTCPCRFRLCYFLLVDLAPSVDCCGKLILLLVGDSGLPAAFTNTFGSGCPVCGGTPCAEVRTSGYPWFQATGSINSQ